MSARVYVVNMSVSAVRLSEVNFEVVRDMEATTNVD